MYLIRKKKPNTIHLWNGTDTVCRMYSTGGLNKKHYKVIDSSDLPICTMCKNKQHQSKVSKANFHQNAVNSAVVEYKNKVRKVPTTMNVWLAITAAHFENMVPFKTFSDPSGYRMETTYGLRGADFPLIHVRTTWDYFDDKGEPINEQHEYWLMVSF